MTDSATNPLLNNWTGPNGSPDFTAIQTEHFVPALKTAIHDAKQKIDIIQHNTQRPDFTNTIVALELVDDLLKRIYGLYHNLLSAQTSDELVALSETIDPLVSDFYSDISLNAELFARVKTVYKTTDTSTLDSESRMLLEKSWKGFVRNGALLPDDQKQRLRDIDAQLSQLATRFGDNALKATKAFVQFIEDISALSGLPETALISAADEARKRGKPEGVYAFTLDQPSYLAVLTHAENRQLRETMWQARSRLGMEAPYDNRDLLLNVARLRVERAHILGYTSHAAYVLEERMAQTVETVQAFMCDLLPVVKPVAIRDLDALQAFAQEQGFTEILKPWDLMYWAEKWQAHLFGFDSEALRPYFPVEQGLAGVFNLASQLYGLCFTENQAYQVYHPDVKAYAVTDSNSGVFIGSFLSDFYVRDSKRGGAWMTVYREQGLSMDGDVCRPVVSIVCNFPKPAAGQPSLLTHDDVSTLFHEFGHALHGLLSQCRYQSISGTNVYWDFVELPSQFMENWALEKTVLQQFARHYQTNEVMPADLINRLKQASQFMAASAALRQLQLIQLDLSWHGLKDLPKDAEAIEMFENELLAPLRIMPAEGAMVSTGFSHIFNGGYAAGYYSYKWAEVLDADAFEKFREDGLFNPDTAKAFRSHILEKGGSEHPAELYRRFRGRNPDPAAMLRRDGLVA